MKIVDKEIKTHHRFIDEAGDTAFYNSKGEWIAGTNGVSKTFSLGMLTIKEPLDNIRSRVIELQKGIENNHNFNTIPSVKKRINKCGFHFHCKDDVPEIRMIFLEFIANIDCSFEMIVGRKIAKHYNDIEHNFSIESNFYAELLSNLLKKHLQREPKIILNIAERGKTTSNKTIESAIEKAKIRFENNTKNKKPMITTIKFSVQNQQLEPLLNIVDYFCWTVQRLFEKGDLQYCDYLRDKISLVVDFYDTSKYSKGRNYYRKERNPLTISQHIKKEPPINLSYSF